MPLKFRIDVCSSWLLFSRSVVSNSLQLHGLQHTRLPCPSPSHVQAHVHWVCDASQPSPPLSSRSPPAFNHSQHPLGPVQRVFSNESAPCIRGQSIRASASTSVLPMHIQCWFPLEWTGLISLLSKGLSEVFFSTTVWRHQFCSAQPFLFSSSHIHTWLLEKRSLRLCGCL